jgi:hypothetical protein
MLSIIGIKKTIKQHTADMDITDSVDYKISAPPRNHVCYITHIGLIPLYTMICMITDRNIFHLLALEQLLHLFFL